jgi:hypothetical protein
MTSHENKLYEIEARLAGTLKRVRPPSGLTQRLRDRIRLPEPRLLAERLSDWRFYFLTVGGVVSGLLIVITVARAIFHLTSRKGG